MPESRRKSDVTRRDLVEASMDREIATLARRQFGVVALRQLTALGLSPRAVQHRAAAGRLHRIHHGVYAVGHPLLAERGHWMAAVLACGEGAGLCDVAAAALWDIRRSDAARFAVVVRTSGGRSRPGLRIHRRPTVRDDEMATRHGIRVTTPARTLLDLAAILSRDRLERALDRTEILELTDYPALDAIARAHPNHRGATKLRAAIVTYLAGTLTRSDLEALFIALCRRHGLPLPRVNQHLDGREVDFLFAEQRLIVEIDSWRYHKTRRAFEADRARDAAHLAKGYRTVRFTDRRLQSDEHGVAATLRAALAGARAA
jgi:very-short-patch-repair endonuclease